MMKPVQFFLFSFLLFSCDLFSQKKTTGLDTTRIPYTASIAPIPLPTTDTSGINGEIPQGIIYVRKPIIVPYVKVNYKLYLSHVNPKGAQREVPVTEKNTEFTEIQVEDIPTFDSAAYSKKLERIYPKKDQLLSKYFVEKLKFRYQANDTPRVDTMLIGMWIDRSGKVKRVMPYTDYVGNMPYELVDELENISFTISDWGEKGGYRTKKKFLKPSQEVFESYYCEAYVIVSSYPLTVEQKETGTSYAIFDYPLNSPASDEQQKASMEKNRKSPELK